MNVTRDTHRLRVVVWSSLALALFASVVLATSPTVRATSGSVIRFQGQSADASFDATSPDGCVDTSVFVSGTQNNGSGSPEADLFISQFDTCTQTELLFASGRTPKLNLQVEAKLSSATLSATVPVTTMEGGTPFDISVSMTWTATGALVSEHGTSHVHTQGLTENFHFDGTFRDASASSTVSDGTTNFTPSPSVFAQIDSAKSVDVTIIHP